MSPRDRLALSAVCWCVAALGCSAETATRDAEVDRAEVPPVDVTTADLAAPADAPQGPDVADASDTSPAAEDRPDATPESRPDAAVDASVAVTLDAAVDASVAVTLDGSPPARPRCCV